nr:hypothetical protein TetV2_00633 [Oceanusvirus sp.]
MKPWNAVKLINSSGLAPSEKAKCMKRARKRMSLRFEKEHLLALRLPPVDTVLSAKKMDIHLDFEDLFSCADVDKIDTHTIVAVAEHIPVSLRDLKRVRSFMYDQAHLAKTIGMTFSWEEVSAAIRPLYCIKHFKSCLDRLPSMDELIALPYMDSDQFINLCREFGKEPTFQQVMQATAGYSRNDVYWKCQKNGISVPSSYLLENGFTCNVLVRHMISTACPLIWNARLVDYGYFSFDQMHLVVAKLSVFRIQKFFRFVMRRRAAKKIQRAWRKATSDPRRLVGKRRLVREFYEITDWCP